MKRAALLVALLPLCGCITLGGSPRGPSEATVARSWTLGLVFGCGMLGLGLQRCDEIRIDVRTCGVAVVEDPDPATKSLLGAISDRVRAACLHQKETPDAP